MLLSNVHKYFWSMPCGKDFTKIMDPNNGYQRWKSSWILNFSSFHLRFLANTGFKTWIRSQINVYFLSWGCFRTEIPSKTYQIFSRGNYANKEKRNCQILPNFAVKKLDVYLFLFFYFNICMIDKKYNEYCQLCNCAPH